MVSGKQPYLGRGWRPRSGSSYLFAEDLKDYPILDLACGDVQKKLNRI
jgi:hypothetical protein